MNILPLQLNGFSNVFVCMNQIFTLVCLTVDRYLAVVKPLRHRTIMTRHTTYRMMVVVYFLSILLAFIPILGTARYKYDPRTNHCSPAWTNSCGYGVGMTIVAFIFPLIGMFITYTRIFRTLRKRRVLVSNSAKSTLSSKDIPNMESNSLDNFEDTTTDDSGDTSIRVAAHKILPSSNDRLLDGDLQPGASLDNLVEKKTVQQHTTKGLTVSETTEKSKGKLVKYDDENCLSGANLEEDLIKTKSIKCKISGDSKEKLVGNNLCSSTKQCDLETDEHLAKHDSIANGIKNEADTSDDSESGNPADLENEGVFINESKTRITFSDVRCRDEKALKFNEPKKTNSRKGLSVLSKDSPSTSSDNETDVFEEEAIVPNKQVSFENCAKVSPSETKVDEERAQRLSIIFPISRSSRAINVLVNRMKKCRHEYKIARTGTILLLSFVILWMPYVVAHSCFLTDCLSMAFYSIATFLVYTNALANPIIYALTNRAVMQDIRKSMGKLCRSK